MYIVKIGKHNTGEVTQIIHSTAQVDDRVIINATLTLQVNTAGTFAFTMLPNHPLYDELSEPLETIVDVYEDDEIIWRGRVTSIDRDFYAQKNVSCEGALSFLSDTVQAPHKYSKALIPDFLADVISKHNAQVTGNIKRFTVGTIAPKYQDKKASAVVTYDETLSVISAFLVAKRGGYITLDISNANQGITINYIESYSGTEKHLIEFGVNLLDLAITKDSSEFCTVVVPLGENVDTSATDGRRTIASVNGGSIYYYDQNLVDQYGWICSIIEDSEEDSASALKTWAQQEYATMVADWRKLVIEIKAVDLAITDQSKKSFRLGDGVRVKSEPHNVNSVLPVTSMVIDINNPTNNTYTLGYAQDPKISGIA